MGAPTQPKKRSSQKRATPAKKAAPKAPAPTSAKKLPIHEEGVITPASQWSTNTAQGFVIELPSGNFAKVKRTLNLAVMLETGEIPNPLADIVRDMMNTNGSVPDLTEEKQEDVIKIMAFIESLMCDLFVQPKVMQQPPTWDVTAQGAWQPPEGAIKASQVSLEDQMYVFAFAQGAALDVGRFREQAVQALATASDVPDLADSAFDAPGGE